jgi:hypothetical protein
MAASYSVLYFGHPCIDAPATPATLGWWPTGFMRAWTNQISYWEYDPKPCVRGRGAHPWSRSQTHNASIKSCERRLDSTSVALNSIPDSCPLSRWQPCKFFSCWGRTNLRYFILVLENSCKVVCPLKSMAFHLKSISFQLYWIMLSVLLILCLGNTRVHSCETVIIRGFN